MPTLQLSSGETIAIDEKGYLLDFHQWTAAVAEQMALNDGIILVEDHWAVFEIFQKYYLSYDIEPPMRVLVKQSRARFGDEKGNSRYLYQLFPNGPGTQACRYAGLPRPVSCI